MKCKHCDGDGVIVDVEYGHAGKYMCDYCWGTGVVEPMTEQEYLQTCTTEQLAEWMALRLNQGILLALRMKYHCDGVDAVREWLKEKHD